MQKVVSKLTKGLRGEIIIPADKSISHRAVMLASIAEGESVITNFSSGADCKSTVGVFKSLGVNIEFLDEKNLKIEGGTLSAPIYPLNAGNSGTTMRLVTGILAGQSFDSVFEGDESLSKRPMKRIIEPLSQMGAEIEAVDGHAPLTIKGHRLKGIDYISRLSSAQVKSAVLLAGLNAQGQTTFTEPYPSRDHTERMLKYLGAKIETNGNKVTIYPSKLKARDIEVVGDISSAAFFIVAGLIVKSSDFVIKNIGVNPTRIGILDVVRRMNAEVELLNEREVAGEPCADVRVKYCASLKGCVIEGADIPRLIDELPVIAVLASQAEGKTIVKDAGDLRNKEADRISCLVKELQKIGVDIEETPNGFLINGGKTLTGGAELEVYHDHRLAMSFYIAGLVCKNEIKINDFEWTNISFPEFEELFRELSLN